VTAPAQGAPAIAVSRHVAAWCNHWYDAYGWLLHVLLLTVNAVITSSVDHDTQCQLLCETITTAFAEPSTANSMLQHCHARQLLACNCDLLSHHQKHQHYHDQFGCGKGSEPCCAIVLSDRMFAPKVLCRSSTVGPALAEGTASLAGCCATLTSCAATFSAALAGASAAACCAFAAGAAATGVPCAATRGAATGCGTACAACSS
jgi:hypothetical protein